MTRTDDDSWDLASSVGATATMVAAARAVASKDPRGLINDPFAEPLVRAVGIDLFVKLLDGDIDLSQLPSGTIRFEAMIAGMMVRTKFFDDFFIEAGEASVRQAVILASGLDSRAYRLAWPAGTVVYEIDQPEVLEFKSRTLTDIGAEPTATRHAVPIDLREDWPAALQAAGFDSTAPTAWSAEGLLIYLPSDAQDRLFDMITELSAPGSVLATHYVPGIRQFDAEKVRERTQPLRDLGLEIDLPSLVYAGHRSPVLDYLVERGWHVTGFPRDELFGHYGLDAPSREDSDQIDEVINVKAARI
jgi:methyltransferase (TIGR00027 family)